MHSAGGLTGAKDKLLHSLFFVVPFLVYALTAAPTVFTLDSAELTTAAATLGITRSTGYPLYIMLGYLWSHIPVGDIGYRLNLFSALWGAVTLLALELALYKLGIRLFARAAAVLLLGTNVYFWSLSTVAEVYTLNTALIALAFLAMVSLHKQVSPVSAVLFGLLVGLSFTNHGTALMLNPAYLFFWVRLVIARKAPVRMLAIASLGVVVGLTPYLYLPLRYTSNPVFNYAGYFDAAGIFRPFALNTVDGLITHITGRNFYPLFFAVPLDQIPLNFLEFLVALNRGFFILGFGLGLLGLLIQVSIERWITPTLLIGFLSTLGFLLEYRVVDRLTMFLPLYLIWAVWLAYGLEASWSVFHRWITGSSVHGSRVIKGAVSVFVFAFYGFVFYWNLSLVERENTSRYRERADEIFNQVEENAVIFGYWDTIPILQYLQLVENQRQDVGLLNKFLISDSNARQYIHTIVGKRPIYSSDSNLLAGNELDYLVGLELYRIIDSDHALTQVGRDP